MGLKLLKGLAAAAGVAGAAAVATGTIGDSIASTFKDQYLEFFTCDALGQNVLAKRGANKITKGNNKGSVDVITQGSKIAVPEGVACILVSNSISVTKRNQPNW